MSKYLLGVDIGTSACKVAVFSTDGRVLSQASREYAVLHPAPGHVEQDPEEWYRAVCEAIKDCLATGKIDPKAIAGVGVDGQSWSAIPVDRNGKVLARTPIWMDTRATDIASETLAQVGFDRIFEVSGNGFEATYSTPKMLWFKKYRPEVYRQGHRFLQSNSWIVYRLTGIMSQDKSQGYGVHTFNMKAGAWDDALCDELGIDRAHLPDISECDQVIGSVNAKAAAETGLAIGTPVVAGGLDAACGTLGAGVVRPGQVQEQGGQAGGMSICVDKALAHPKLILSFHVVPKLWLLQGGTVGGGGALRWFRQELGGAEEVLAKAEGRNAFEILSREASTVAPGADGVVFLPYMSGERSPIWDRNAKGVFYGLSYATTRAHMVRAVMEGCALTLEHNLRTSAETGVSVNELVAMAPVYIVGSEVPIPGGAQEEEEGLHVTTVDDFKATVETFRAAFAAHGLKDAWERVIAVVVQPGVEFGDESIHEYDRAAAKTLCAAGKTLPNLVFEGHSTDYQTPQALKMMVEDGIATLKVGPALTFALREALFSLNMIEKELFRYSPEVRQSNLIEVLDEAMLRRPGNWKNHYHGTPAKIRLARKYSFSDRARYDLPDPEVQESLALLLNNLGAVKIPLTLVSQFMPIQYRHIRDGKISGKVTDLLKDRVMDCIEDYLFASTP